MKRRKISAVIFDLDGTLVDTAPDYVAVVNQLLVENNVPTLKPSLIRQHLSYGATELIRVFFGIGPTHNEFQRLKLRLLEIYSANLAVRSHPFLGIDSLIKHLGEHGISWGIATHKPAIYTIPLISQLKLSPPPQCIICPDDVVMRKPNPESLFLAASKIGCSPEDMIFIGDHRRDIECGKQAGCLTIAAAYGYIRQEDDIKEWGADYCVENADSIWDIVSILR